MNGLLQEILACATGPAKADDNGVHTMTFCFPPSFSAFSGHFPAHPILPGMVQIQIGVLAAGQGQTLDLDKIGRTKFSRIVRPGEIVQVEADTTKTADRITAEVRITTDGEAVANMTLLLKNPGDAQ